MRTEHLPYKFDLRKQFPDMRRLETFEGYGLYRSTAYSLGTQEKFQGTRQMVLFESTGEDLAV